MTKRVAIIGAGPCGLAQIRAFKQAENKGAKIPEIVCFEKQSDWGGLWKYDWRISVDEFGEPQHGSMYRYLWSNGPKECLEFADYTFEHHFGKAIPSFPPRAVLKDYIIGRAKDTNARSWIRFKTAVRNMSYDENTKKFTIRSEHVETKEQTQEEFDHVIVSTGHFSVPQSPNFKGIECFTGMVIHSHDFRESSHYKKDRLLVVGGSYSAEDIALQCYKYGCKDITISYRTAAMGFKWPQGIEERPEIEQFDGNKVTFKDGHTKEIDAVILCTGYRHSFPFLDQSLALNCHNRLYPPKLYKGVVWQDNHNLFYLGMQDQFYTFNMFDAQAWYVRDIIMDRIILPDNQTIDQDIKEWVAREEKLQDDHDMIYFQTDYTQDLLDVVDYPKIDLQLIAKNFEEWEHDKVDDILKYRDKAFRSPCTNTKAPIHHTPWLDAMDDSLDEFMNN